MTEQTYKITSELFEEVYTNWYSTSNFADALPDAQEFFEQDICGVSFKHFTESQRVYKILNEEKLTWAKLKYGV